MAGSTKASCVFASTLSEPGSTWPGRVDDELQVHRSGDAGALPSRAGSAAADRKCAAPGSSSCEVRKTWPSSTGPVPPSMPAEMPPSTPLPEKSFGSKGFALRSTGGMSFGMMSGGTTVWNPFGGGIRGHHHILWRRRRRRRRGLRWLQEDERRVDDPLLDLLGGALRGLDGREDDHAVDDQRQDRLTERLRALVGRLDQVLEHYRPPRTRLVNEC